MALVYRDGLKLPKVMCHRCSSKRDGTVRREGPRWAIHLECGHVKTAGWTMPVEELRKRGLVTTQTPVDPRAIMSKRLQQEDIDKELREKAEFIKRQRDRGKV